MPDATCCVGGCDRPRRKRGWCETHYKRWLRHGDVNAVSRVHLARNASIGERFWAKVDRSGSCWRWIGCIGDVGYGRFVVSSGLPTAYAHRVAYELTWGAIPKGLHLDHLCRNRWCVNPRHLEPVTCAENQRRGVEDRRAA